MAKNNDLIGDGLILFGVMIFILYGDYLISSIAIVIGLILFKSKDRNKRNSLQQGSFFDDGD
jgi:hypothetical protein